VSLLKLLVNWWFSQNLLLSSEWLPLILQYLFGGSWRLICYNIIVLNTRELMYNLELTIRLLRKTHRLYS
jgi:hypothetical protein